MTIKIYKPEPNDQSLHDEYKDGAITVIICPGDELNAMFQDLYWHTPKNELVTIFKEARKADKPQYILIKVIP